MRCPRCRGKLFREYRDVYCLTCGYRNTEDDQWSQLGNECRHWPPGPGPGGEPLPVMQATRRQRRLTNDKGVVA